MNEKFANLFAIGCIIIVCMFGFNIGEQTIGIEQPKNIIGTTNQTGTVKKPKEITITGEINRSISKSTVIKSRDGNSKGYIKTKIQPLGTDTIVYVKGFPEDSMATIVNTIYYARNGIEANRTLKGENGGYNLTLQSNCRNKQGIQERGFGLCQLQEKYHAPFIWKGGYRKVGKIYVVDKVVASKLGFTDDFLDPVKQAHYCMDVWDDAERKGRISTTFYAYNVRHKYKDDFIIKQQ